MSERTTEETDGHGHCSGCGRSLNYYGVKWVTTDGEVYCPKCAADIEWARG